MTSQLQVTGTTLKRFVQAGTLLWLLDPVRGEASVHNLDTHTGHTQQEASERQRSKFLDSISLICATRKDGDTVSAATLEEGAPEGTIVRVASNAGIPEETLRRVQDIIKILNEIAKAGVSAVTETQILTKIIELDIEKIRHYLERIQRYSQVIHNDVNWITANSSCLDIMFEQHESHGFLEWIAGLYPLTMGDSNQENSRILAHIQWATKAKWTYSQLLETTFKARGTPVPPWVVNVYKLGRYAVAGQVLLHFALENRSLFSPMLVEALPAPPKQRYQPSLDGNHLDTALRRSIGGDVGESTMRLARYWNVTDPESHFRRKCPCELTVHAELQLVNFYHDHRDRMPRKRFIGVSKKSCFLCYNFLQRHPFNFTVSACHQKLYLNWIPPSRSDPKTYKQYKRLTAELSEMMERFSKHEIEQKLVTGARRPIPLDSTAGVSLPAAITQHVISQTESDARHNIYDDEVFEQEEWRQHSVQYNLTPQNVFKPGTHDGDSLDGSGSITDTMGSPVMTFLIKRTDDKRRQDIVTITELIDPASEKPKWELLCIILASNERFGIGFDHDREFLLINQSLRVGSDRQFTACLEYLRNAQSWNNEVSVHTYEDLKYD